MPSKVIIIDYGSQVTQLIARRVREAGVYSEIHPCVVTAAQVKAMQPSAIILSGGPASVGEKDAPALDKGFLDLGVPVLGICYGMQLLAFNLGGGLEQSETREYGPADLRFVRSCALWDGIDLTKLSRVWMSNGDTVKTPPAGFLVTGSTDTLEVAAIELEMEGKAMGKFFKELKNQSRPKTVLMEMFSYIKIFSAAILTAFVLTRCVIVNAETPTSSMENTIMTGDRYFGLRISYLFEEPQRQEIIVFKFPDDESRVFVKRIIGIPGDIVEIKNDTVYVNGEQLEEPYLKEPMSLGQNMVFEVPADSYFVMGDNRNISNDARYWNNTYVKKEQIIGKAMVKYYSGKVTFEVLK